MIEKSVYMTAEGMKKLQEELKLLKEVKRPEVAAMIKEAKDAGDVSENAGYDEAKEKQAFIEGRIQDLESLLKRAELIKEGKGDGTVVVGSHVTIQEEGGEPEHFRLVGSAEADPTRGTISNESPLGRALLGKRAGDSAVITTPDGSPLRFEILEVG